MIDALNKKTRRFSFPADGDIRLDAGCGTNKREGFVGLDLYDYGQEIVWDMQEGVPLPDNSCAEIFCAHVLEHVQDMVGVMAEFWRVLKKDGELRVFVPYKTARRALLPVHLRLLDEETFRYFEGYEGSNERARGPEKWKIKEMIVNDRPDLVVIMTPVK